MKRAERVPEEVQIVDLTHDGRGVARTGGKVRFVAGALPSETVTAVRMKRRRAHDECQVVDVLVPSADRVKPICRFFGVCGGCTLQHLSSDGQVAMKQRILADHFREADVEAPVLFPPISGEDLLMALDLEGVAASSGSACTAGSLEPSHVLLAMGNSDEVARQALRLSFGPSTTDEELIEAAKIICACVGRLKKPHT